MDENSRRLSRTRAGLASTSSSSAKRPLLLSGNALRRRAAANEQRVYRSIFVTRHDPPPADGAAVLDLLWRIADLTNAGLLPAGKLRTWLLSTPDRARAGRAWARLPPDQLPAALAELGQQLQQRWAELVTDPLPLAAWAEWELNCGRLHPFYDGCGRIARSFGALLLLRAGCLLPLHADQASYYDHGDRGPDAFTTYLRDRVAACAAWLERSG
jgi:Fic/DOC family protein